MPPVKPTPEELLERYKNGCKIYREALDIALDKLQKISDNLSNLLGLRIANITTNEILEEAKERLGIE